jgi:hypothetical protein
MTSIDCNGNRTKIRTPANLHRHPISGSPQP